MAFRCGGHKCGLVALLALGNASLLAQDARYPQTPAPAYQRSPVAAAPAPQGRYPQTDYRVAQQPAAPAPSQVAPSPPPAQSTVPPAQQAAPPAQAAPAVPEHPLIPTLRWAHGAYKNLGATSDYSATFIKRERIDDELGEHQYLFVKVRHKPFSVYIYFLGPAEVKGREAIYVEGRNNGHLLAHTTGLKDSLVGTLTLKTDSAMAMQGNRHPVTDIGLLQLTRKTIASCEKASQFNDCDVKYFPGAKINGRTCTCMQVVYPTPRRELTYHMTRLFIDDELSIPTRYEAYEFPEKAGEQPPLAEEYTYLNLKFNNNFTDADFDHRNPAYRFK